MFALVSCHEEDDLDFGPVETGYPSTYQLLSNSVLNQYKNEYGAANHPGLYTSIDTFGFISSNVQTEYNLEKYKFGVISQNRAKSRAKKFLQENSKFTGVTDTLLLKFYRAEGMKRYEQPDFCHWNVVIENQRFNGLEVEDTRISLHLDSLGVYRAGGHWYPEIIIPSNDNLSYEMAKTRIDGLKLSTGSWSGPINHTIGVSTEYQEPAERKVIYPLQLKNRIELRVAWQLYPEMWRVLVDTSTGEIISTGPTVIF